MKLIFLPVSVTCKNSCKSTLYMYEVSFTAIRTKKYSPKNWNTPK